MSIEIIRYNLKAHTAEELLAAYAAAAEHLRNSPHCLAFALTRCEEAPAAFILRIEWTSTKDHLEGFRRSESFRPFLALIRPFMAEIEEMRHYQPTEISWRQP